MGNTWASQCTLVFIFSFEPRCCCASFVHRPTNLWRLHHDPDIRKRFEARLALPLSRASWSEKLYEIVRRDSLVRGTRRHGGDIAVSWNELMNAYKIDRLRARDFFRAIYRVSPARRRIVDEKDAPDRLSPRFAIHREKKRCERRTRDRG